MATVGFNDFTPSTNDSDYRWWQANPSIEYTVNLALDTLDEIYTFVAYVPLNEDYTLPGTFNLNANVAYAATGAGDDTINFPTVMADPDDPSLLPSYTITVVAGSGNDTINKVPDFGVNNATTITLIAYGGAESDLINGGKQSDFLHGDSYNTINFSNTLVQNNQLALPTPDSAAGDDSLFGYRGSDTIHGGAGNDVIDAGPRGYGDTDVVTGGPGADNFLLSYNADGTAGGTDFWSIWAQNLVNDEVGQVVSSVVADLLGAGASIADGIALGGLGQILGASVESFVDFLIALEASPTPSSGPDVLVVTDFDPSEDVIFVPVAQNVTLNNSVEFFQNAAGVNGWGIKFSDNDSNTYAEVMLSEDFLKSVGVSQEQSNTAQALLQSVLSRSTVIESDGGFDSLTSQNVLSLLPGGGYSAPSNTPVVPAGTKLAAWGAIGPIVADGSVAGIGDAGTINFGTQYSDALTSNPHFVNPADFTLSDSGPLPTLIQGYAGNDLIFGTTHSDTLAGGDDNDVIYTFMADIENGELVPETVTGGRGADTVYTGASGGTFDGGDGGDTLIFFYGEQIDSSKTPAKAYQVVIDLTATTPIIIDAVPTGSTNVAPDSTTPPFTTALNTYSVTNFETFIGGPLNDWVRGSNGTTIGGGAGPDYLDIGAGDMGLTYQTSAKGVTAVLQQGLLELKGGDATGDVLVNMMTGSTYNVSSLTGSEENDSLYIVASGTTMYGLGGTDTFGLFFDPNNTVSMVEIPDFGQDDIIDLRKIGATSFGQLQIIDGFAFEYTDPTTNQQLRALLNDNNLPLTASNFIFASAASGTAVGSRRDDGIVGGGDDDQFDGRGGDDALHGNDGDDELIGRQGNDLLIGGNGRDSLLGGAGSDRLEGGRGADSAHAGGGADYVHLGAGADIGRGGAGDDTLHGGGSADTLTGGSGDDEILGQNGEDVLRGMDGDDRLLGGAGEDVLFGGAGDDTLTGGLDADRMAGGEGEDLFLLRFGDIEGDIIVDFDAGEGDRITIADDRALTVSEVSDGIFSVTDGRFTQTFEAAGASLDDISVILV
ncbi:calcium-binding protein [Acuticoccus kandeliae]|uniref:calcium-binding protein n=1 Tax=Acuticoccus kandeliae TaxID=2073160 RepID=UPI000D3EBB65|nr:calcium-binding protein [Acuticoccus kandeliae]